MTSEERDHPLPFLTRVRLVLHRSFCVRCARYARQLDVMQDGMRDLREQYDEPIDTRLSKERKARLKSALRGDAAR